MFENLSERIERAVKNLKGQGAITEINVAETVKDIRRALLEADVNFKIAKEFTNKVKEKALGQKVLTSVSPGQLLVKITQDELTDLMGSSQSELKLSGNPAVIMVAGLQGAGKTTFCAKLAHYLKSKNKVPYLVACDVYRPAAIDQLEALAEQVDTGVYSNRDTKNVIEIAKAGIVQARQNKANVVIIDTAGRLAIDEEMMEEIKKIKKAIKPQEALFVVDAMIGQDAVQTAKAFNDAIDLTGVVLTKLDGDTRGGAALSVKAVVDRPVKFVGTGEKIEALEVFYPDRMASRILGQGDIISFVEKAQEHFDEKKEKALKKKIKKSKLDFNDLRDQLKQLKSMGSIRDVVGMLPGANKMLRNQNFDVMSDKFNGIEAMIQSMTPEERENPTLLDHRRKSRIANGSGKSIEDVNRMVKQLNDMQKMMKRFSGGRMPKMPF